MPGLTKKEAAPVRVLTSIEFLLGGVKVYETPLVEANAINIPERDAVAFQFDVPLTGLKTGHLRLPGQRHRRRGRQLHLPAHGPACSSGSGAIRTGSDPSSLCELRGYPHPLTQ